MERQHTRRLVGCRQAGMEAGGWQATFREAEKQEGGWSAWDSEKKSGRQTMDPDRKASECWQEQSIRR